MGAIVCAAPATARRVPSVTTGTRKTASRLGVDREWNWGWFPWRWLNMRPD